MRIAARGGVSGNRGTNGVRDVAELRVMRWGTSPFVGEWRMSMVTVLLAWRCGSAPALQRRGCAPRCHCAHVSCGNDCCTGWYAVPTRWRLRPSWTCGRYALWVGMAAPSILVQVLPRAADLLALGTISGRCIVLCRTICWQVRLTRRPMHCCGWHDVRHCRARRWPTARRVW